MRILVVLNLKSI